MGTDGDSSERARRRGIFGVDVALRLAPALISGALRCVRATSRIDYVDCEPLFRAWAERDRTLLAFWHDRVVMMPVLYRGAGICILNSPSRDGDIATRALERWGIQSVRGSASRGGTSGFLKLLRASRRGLDLALVPDGPRGPRHQAKAGIVHLARATGVPLYPIAYAASRRLRLRSWDRLIVPLPFARVVFVAGAPLRVPRDADEATLESLRLEVAARLDEVTARAEPLVASPRRARTRIGDLAP